MGTILKKKGQSGTDIIFMVAFLLMFSIAALVGKMAWTEMSTSMKSNEVINSSAPAISAIEAADTANNLWDYVFLILFVGFTIGMVVLGYFIPARPAFVIMFILVLMLAVVLSGVMSNVWAGVYNNLVFQNSDMDITNHIMSNLMLYVTMVGALAMIATYSKTRGDNEMF